MQDKASQSLAVRQTGKTGIVWAKEFLSGFLTTKAEKGKMVLRELLKMLSIH